MSRTSAARVRAFHPRARIVLLEEAQQLGLEDERQLANLVEEQSSSVGCTTLPSVSVTAPVNEPRGGAPQ